MRHLTGRVRARLSRSADHSAGGSRAAAGHERSDAPGGGPLDGYASLLPRRDGLRVVLLADERVGAELADHVAAFPGAEVTVLAGQEQPEWRLDELGAGMRRAGPVHACSAELRSIGPVDVLVNLRRASGQVHLRTWRRLFFHLRRNGAYVVDRRAVEDRAEVFLGALGRVGRHVGAGSGDLGKLPPRLREHARSVGRLVIGSDVVLVTKRNQHLVKIRDDQHTTRVLRSRRTGLDVTPLGKRRGGVLHAAGSITSYGTSTPLDGLETEIRYPPMFLRRYEGRIALGPWAQVVHDHSVLPESFRWYRQADPINTRLVNVDEEFARWRGQHRPVRTLAGSYYHLDYANPGHFGHLMTEAVAKLWGWDAAKAADPDLKVLLRTAARDPDRPEPRLETRLLEAYGVDRDDMVWVDEPVWVESLVGASPMWHNKAPYHVHPDLTEVWARLREGMASPDAPRADKILVSRRGGVNRACRNVRDVEELFTTHGFSVVFPEDLDLADQAGLFAHARVVAGFGGSGMFSLMYAAQRPTVIVLNHEAYDSRNEHLYAAALGSDAHYFWSAPDLPQPESGFSYEAFQSGWEFDFGRNGAELERLLRSLA